MTLALSLLSLALNQTPTAHAQELDSDVIAAEAEHERAGVEVAEARAEALSRYRRAARETRDARRELNSIRRQITAWENELEQSLGGNQEHINNVREQLSVLTAQQASAQKDLDEARALESVEAARLELLENRVAHFRTDQELQGILSDIINDLRARQQYPGFIGMNPFLPGMPRQSFMIDSPYRTKALGFGGHVGGTILQSSPLVRDGVSAE